MLRRKHLSSPWFFASALFTVVPTATASALQPLSTFLQAARRSNFDNREVAANTRQRAAEGDVAQTKLLPTLSASGTYTFNQYEVSFDPGAASGASGSGTKLVIQPQHQLDGALTISVPIIDFGAWRRISAADAATNASRSQETSTQLDVETVVYHAYYELLGQEAVLDAAKRTLEVLRKNLEQVEIKVAGGTASQLDVQRARAEVARAEGDVAGSEFAVVTARRQLATATATEPEPASEFISDDLHAEQPLDTWLARAGNTPRVLSAQAAHRAAELSADAAESAWYPTLSANAQERFTNATSFVGRNAYFLAQLNLSWRFDWSNSHAVRAQNAAASAQQVRAERVQRAAQDSIYQSWHQVRSAIEKARAARVQIEASKLAAGLARDRYTAGAATQLDVLQAEHEAFRAEVAGIQADTALAYARASLRASAGLFSESGAK